jgi:hypothetical protein
VATSALHLSLIVPGLLQCPLGVTPDQLGSLQLPALERILNSARQETKSEIGYYGALASCFGLSGADRLTGHAPLSFLGYHGEAPSAPTLRADPVYLRAETDYLVLFDASVLDLQSTEAAELSRTLNEFLKADGNHVECLSTTQWCLTGESVPENACAPLRQAIGRNIGPFLPTGKDGLNAKRLLNELQMLLHEHPVNRYRRTEGRLPVNSLWLWGAGRLPGESPVGWAGVWSNDYVALGLGRLGGAQAHPMPSDLESWLKTQPLVGKHAVVIDTADGPASRGDAVEWRATLERMDKSWFSPLTKALNARQLASVRILSCDGRLWHYQSRRWRALFHRRRTIPELMNSIVNGEYS